MGKFLFPLVFLLCLLSIFSCANSAEVLVIGAGVSGLNAANILTKANHVVTVLEGRNRIGGRVWSDTSFGYALDLGAAWIHGINSNPIYTLAKSNGVTTVNFNYDDVKYYSTSLTANELSAVSSTMSSASKGFLSYVENYRSNTKTDDSLYNVLQSYLKSKTIDSASQTCLNNYIFSELEIEFANRIENMSAINYDSSSGLRGEDVLMPNGYIGIFEPLSKGLNIVFNQTVNSITTANNKVTVTTTDNKSYTADFVVLTVPLGILKKGSIKFSPELSDAKKNAISKLGFGVLDKVIVEFSEKFWDDFSLLRILNTPVTAFGWAVNLNKVAGKNTLIFLVGGENKYYDLYNNNKAAIEAAVVNVLKTIYPNKNISVVRSIITNWRMDPFALGSYTSYAVGADPSMVDEFSKREGNVFFAGEHTHKNYIQTIQGAYLSGERAANQVITARGSFIKFSLLALVFIFAFLL